MNAPAPAALTQEAFQILNLVELAPSTTRTQERRRARFTKQEIAELAANVKSVGIMLPIIVRPHPKPVAPVKYEIVAGERRWLAGREAGLVEAPVIVRSIADADVVQFQLTENLQRKTIDQLEEAEGYDELRKLKKINADQVADLLGVSRSTVFNRLKLLDLCPEARKAFEEGKLGASNAMLIARIGHHDTQRRVLKESAESEYNDGPMTYRELREHIEEHYMVDLKGAPFKTDDEALLPKAGSCVKCPKRTGNQKDLFADVKNPYVCTDPKCYEDKRQIVFHKAAVELEAKGRKVIAGAGAKKLMPHGNDYVRGGYTKLTEHHYGSDGRSRTVKDILGPGFKPTLIQHPESGKFIEVVGTQALAAALSGKKPKEEKSSAKARPAGPKLDLPDLDDQVTARLIKLIDEKAPAKFSRAFLLSMAKLVIPEINMRDSDLVAEYHGWPPSAFEHGYHGRRLPKQAESFDERKLVVLLVHAVFAANRWSGGRKHILDVFGISENKTRELIIEERKQAQANARMKAKLAKASPLVKSKKPAKKSAKRK